MKEMYSRNPQPKTLQLTVCFICSMTCQSMSLFSPSINLPFLCIKKRFNPYMM